MFVEAGSHNDTSTYTNEIYMGMKTSKFKALRPVWPGVLGIDCHIRVFLTHVYMYYFIIAIEQSNTLIYINFWSTTLPGNF